MATAESVDGLMALAAAAIRRGSITDEGTCGPTKEFVALKDALSRLQRELLDQTQEIVHKEGVILRQMRELQERDARIAELRLVLVQIGTGACEAYDGLTYSEIAEIARAALAAHTEQPAQGEKP
jgi:hypothetical protein